ncbi:MAG: T9SS type A sorting domain-containing protein [Bacteroidetes bacterium]|nr:T9SS type A sorting domain-containing protein [Bacteroidota bacterium]
MKIFSFLAICQAMLLLTGTMFAQTWPTSFGAGMNGDVNALAVDKVNNILYAGGLFTQAGGKPANKIAKWSDTSWQAMGSGVSGNVYAMLFHAGRLYVGGTFDAVDGIPAKNVAYYDGTWHSMDGGLTGTLAEVRAFTVFNNEVIAGGKFSESGLMNNLGNVARWNGATWMSYGTGLNNKVWALEVYRNELYAAGQFDSTGSGIYCYAVGKWNGIIWQSLGEGPAALVRALKIYNNELYAGGNFVCVGNNDLTKYLTSSKICRWNGLKWSNIGPSAWNGGSPANCTGASDLVSALHVFNNELFLGGLFTSVINSGPSSTCAYRIARSNGYFFAPVGPACDGVGGAISFPTVNAIATYNGNLVLGGRFGLAGGNVSPFITLLNPPPVNEINVYHHLEYRHLGMEDPALLLKGRVDIRPLNDIKICADGSKSTVFQFIVKDVVKESYVRFRIKSDSLGQNPDTYGEFNVSDYTLSGDTVTVRYTHPNHLASNFSTFRADSVQITDISNNKILYNLPVKIYRSPVVLIHGLWSDGNFWKPLEKYLQSKGYLPQLTYCPDYEDFNAVAFHQNAIIVPEAIRQTLMHARHGNYSAGACDLVVHSMGGVLSRLYIQQTPYHYDVHKLITVNSVHSGTQTANLLTNPAFAGLNFIFNWGGMDCLGGAVDDFRVNSAAITGSLNGGLLNYRKVPSHTVTSNITVSTFAQQTALNDWTTFFGYAAALFAGFGTEVKAVDAFMASVFQSTSHDLIVPEASQSGGCGKTTSLTPFWHSSIKNHTTQFQEIEQLLLKSPSDTAYFSSNGFQPPILSSLYVLAGNNHNNSQSSGDVMFANLSAIDTITSNMNATFDISSTGNIQRMFLAVIGSPAAILFADTAAPAASVTFPIDNNIFGKAKVVLIGYDSVGVIDIDTVEIVVEDYPGYQCSSLQTYPENIFLPQGSTGTMQATVSCTGGERCVTQQSNCVFEVLDKNVAVNISKNRIKAMQPGETKAVAHYLGLTDTITIIVNDTVNDLVVSGVNLPCEEQQLGISVPLYGNINVKVYPNPFKQTVNFAFNEATTVNNATFVLSDIIGRDIMHLENINRNNFEINLADFGSGIYFYKIIMQDKHASGKILKQ